MLPEDDLESDEDLDIGGGISPFPLPLVLVEGNGAGTEPGRGVAAVLMAGSPLDRRRVGSHGLGLVGGLYIRCRSWSITCTVCQR